MTMVASCSFTTARAQVLRPATSGHRRITCMAGHGRFFVGGNWKCNGTQQSVKELIEGLNAGADTIPKEVDVVVAPTFIHLPAAKAGLKAPFSVSAQDCWVGKGGAFTGEIAAEMLADMGVSWVILGHSERRSLCHETSEIVGQKVEYALNQGLRVIACIGETLQQRESGEMYNVLAEQLKGIADHVTDWSKVVIAYEPVWAIGTGVVATPQQAEEVHEWVRHWLSDNVSPKVTETLRILYGGSVNDANCGELSQLPDVDGFLVGGASLKAESFLAICSATRAKVPKAAKA